MNCIETILKIFQFIFVFRFLLTTLAKFAKFLGVCVVFSSHLAQKATLN